MTTRAAPTLADEAPGDRRPDLDELPAWLAAHGGPGTDHRALVAALCERLIAAGLPLARVSYGVATLHPRVRGRQFIWRPGADGVSEIRHPHGVERSAVYRDSPARILAEGAAAVRRRLEGPAPRLDFPILEELRAEGATDYVAMPLRFSTGNLGFVSWVADRPGGFAADELSLLDRLLPTLTLRLELEASYETSRGLLETYLGEDAARSVLAGRVRRGQVRPIRAAILLSDLRGFTALSDRLPAGDVMTVLNDYFDILVPRVESHGGQVLKFMGDGLLAAFRVETTSRERACCGAMQTAIAAARAITAHNRGRAEPIDVAFGLHLGDVIYGNIGAAGRLDFTVIGPSVNEAARILDLAKRAGQPILVSASFARDCTCERMVSLGPRRLRGVAKKQEIFALPEGRLG